MGYYPWALAGGLQAGITQELAVVVYAKTDDDNINAGLTRGFARLRRRMGRHVHAADERVSSLAEGIALDTPSLAIVAVEGKDSGIAYGAVTALGFRQLTPEQLERIRQAYRDGKFHSGMVRWRWLHGAAIAEVDTWIYERTHCHQPQGGGRGQGYVCQNALSVSPGKAMPARCGASSSPG